jgi:membrane-bound ClpP family serine protease
MENWPVNVIGLGLILAGVILMLMLDVVGIYLGVICILGGIVALFMTYRRRKATSA